MPCSDGPLPARRSQEDAVEGLLLAHLYPPLIPSALPSVWGFVARLGTARRPPIPRASITSLGSCRASRDGSMFRHGDFVYWYWLRFGCCIGGDSGSGLHQHNAPKSGAVHQRHRTAATLPGTQGSPYPSRDPLSQPTGSGRSGGPDRRGPSRAPGRRSPGRRPCLILFSRPFPARPDSPRSWSPS